MSQDITQAIGTAGGGKVGRSVGVGFADGQPVSDAREGLAKADGGRTRRTRKARSGAPKSAGRRLRESSDALSEVEALIEGYAVAAADEEYAGPEGVARARAEAAAAAEGLRNAQEEIRRQRKEVRRTQANLARAEKTEAKRKRVFSLVELGSAFLSVCTRLSPDDLKGVVAALVDGLPPDQARRRLECLKELGIIVPEFGVDALAEAGPDGTTGTDVGDGPDGATATATSLKTAEFPQEGCSMDTDVPASMASPTGQDPWETADGAMTLDARIPQGEAPGEHAIDEQAPRGRIALRHDPEESSPLADMQGQEPGGRPSHVGPDDGQEDADDVGNVPYAMGTRDVGATGHLGTRHIPRH
jgi:hypothetical protein